MKFIYLLSIPLLLSGCVFSGQKVKLAPVATVPQSEQGQNITVKLTVVDERPDQSIGKRGAGGAGAAIEPAEKIEPAIYSAIAQGLKQKGFAVVGEGVSASQLAVEVRFLQYTLAMGFWSGGINIKVTLKAIATGRAKSYDHLYRVDNEKRVQIAPTADTNEQWINEALSAAVTQMLQDDALLGVLAQRN